MARWGLMANSGPGQHLPVAAAAAVGGYVCCEFGLGDQRYFQNRPPPLVLPTSSIINISPQSLPALKPPEREGHPAPSRACCKVRL